MAASLIGSRPTASGHILLGPIMSECLGWVVFSQSAFGWQCMKAAPRHLLGNVSAVWMSAGPLSRSPSTRVEIVGLPPQIGSTG